MQVEYVSSHSFISLPQSFCPGRSREGPPFLQRLVKQMQAAARASFTPTLEQDIDFVFFLYHSAQKAPSGAARE